MSKYQDSIRTSGRPLGSEIIRLPLFKRCLSFQSSAYLFDCFGTGHCSFESENCGLKTDKNATLYWTVGSAQRTRESTGPSYDHTLFNEDGKKRHHWIEMLTSRHQLIIIQSSMVCVNGGKTGIRNQCHFSNRQESNIIQK